jgi:hypothetical protein
MDSIALAQDSSSRNGSSSGLQNGEAAAESVAMVIGTESGAATGPIPAEARRQEGLKLERTGAGYQIANTLFKRL